MSSVLALPNLLLTNRLLRLFGIKQQRRKSAIGQEIIPLQGFSCFLPNFEMESGKPDLTSMFRAYGLYGWQRCIVGWSIKRPARPRQKEQL